MSMTKPNTNPLVRVLPSLTDVAFLMPMVFLFLRMDGAPRLLEGDTGWHIRAGEWILENGRVPDKDIFSFTRPGEAWFAWEWLWDVAFAWLHRHGGLSAVVLASLLVLCVTFALLFRLVRRKCPNALIAIAVTLLAAAGSSMHWLARPHLFTLLLVVVFLSLLERAQDGRTRLLWVLPFLTALWANLHGGFLAGIVLIGCYGAGELAAALVNSQAEERAAARRRSAAYFLSAAGCAVASLANPYSYRLHVHIWRYLADTESPFFRYVSEWQSISFHHAAARYFEVMILLAVAGAAWSLYQRSFGWPLLLAVWLHLALFSARNIPIFLIVAAPVAAEALQQGLLRIRQASVAGWLERAAAAIENLGREVAAVDRVPRLHLVSCAAAALLLAVCYSASAPPKFRSEYDSKAYPTMALDALQGGRVFAPDEWGDYLIYRLYPNTRVYVDGRFDFYGAPFTEEYLDVMNVKHGWDQHLRRYAIDTVLLPVDAPLAGALKEASAWRPVYDDGVAIVFRAAQTATSSIAATCSGRRDRMATPLRFKGANL